MRIRESNCYCRFELSSLRVRLHLRQAFASGEFRVNSLSVRSPQFKLITPDWITVNPKLATRDSIQRISVNSQTQ
jgi:hypothetical protein